MCGWLVVGVGAENRVELSSNSVCGCSGGDDGGSGNRGGDKAGC